MLSSRLFTLTKRLRVSLSTRARRSLDDIERPPPISVTVRAAERIKDMIEGKDDVVGVKIGVKRRGCNGYSYTMNYASRDDVVGKKYEVVNSHGITVLVDPLAIFYILGTEMDYEETVLSSEFTFTNPNSKGECGCGESFNV
mmetsp:Transcript_16617/g.25008  ORF Transcript_16617/g.25008 Transcript_16617/m.25008 type:complete len:142 (-) Transcript_16617:33-458(-)